MYAHVNGVDLYFDIEGGGATPTGPTMSDKPVLFLLHGGPGCDHTCFRPWLHPLAQEMQLVFVDHRGNGRSERVDTATYTIEQMADDVEGLRTYLGLGPISVLGHSFGGMVAQMFALRHPKSLDKLLLANTTPSAKFWDDAQEMAEKMATPEQKAVLPILFEGKIKSNEEWNAWWDTCLSLYFKEPDAQVLADVGGRMIGAYEVANYMMANEIPNYDVRDGIPSITAPTLVLAGRYDWVTPVSQSQLIHELIPGSELVVFENSGHMCYIEETDAYIETLRSFFAR